MNVKRRRVVAAAICAVHPGCVLLAVELAFAGPGVLHLSREEARSLSHQLYYAAIDDDLRLDGG